MTSHWERRQQDLYGNEWRDKLSDKERERLAGIERHRADFIAHMKKKHGDQWC